MNGLQFANVGFGHSRRRPLYQGLDVTFTSGRTILLGPNGAGKSTLMRLAAGHLRPQRGRITVEGTPIAKARGLVGYMPQQIAALPGLTVQEQVTYAGWLRGQSARDSAADAGELVDLVGLGDQRKQSPRTLSGGQLRRLGIAQALAGETRYLLLDEPTAGLDPEQRQRFRQVLADLPTDLGVVISTHDPDELDEGFERVVVIADGRLLLDCSSTDFLARGRSSRPAETAYLDVIGTVESSGERE